MARRPVIGPASPTRVARWTGYRAGGRTIIEVVGVVSNGEERRVGGPGRELAVRVQCECGRIDRLVLKAPSSLKPRCERCGRDAARRRSTEPGTMQTSAERDAFCRAAADRALFESDTAEARITESAIARELGRLSLSEIGDLCELSRERVRQIESGALAKLREALERAEWRAAARRAG